MGRKYDIRDYPPFAVTVDLVALAIRGDELCVLLIRRSGAPFKGGWALPGGFVQRGPHRRDESLDEAAAREFQEETGLPLEAAYLTQLGAYGDPGRDPRGNIVTVAYLAVAPSAGEPQAGGDAAAARWQPVRHVLHSELAVAFDHSQIIRDAVEHTRELIETTGLATAFLDEAFSTPQLRRVYEIVWGLPRDTMDAGNFHNRITRMPGLLEPAGRDEPRTAKAAEEPAAERPVERPQTGRGRPPQLFRAGPLLRQKGPAARLDRPIERPWESRYERRPRREPDEPYAEPYGSSRHGERHGRRDAAWYADAPVAALRMAAGAPHEDSLSSAMAAGVAQRDRLSPDEAKRRARRLIWARGAAGRDLSYAELAGELGLRWNSAELLAALDAVALDEVAGDGPLVTVLVVSQRNHMPGEHFFALAERLGRTVTDPWEFAEAEREAAFAWIREHPEADTSQW